MGTITFESVIKESHYAAEYVRNCIAERMAGKSWREISDKELDAIIQALSPAERFALRIDALEERNNHHHDGSKEAIREKFRKAIKEYVYSTVNESI